MIDLQGTVALVTGAASGIGKATAEALARAGSDVVLCDVRDVETSGVEQAGRRAFVIQADLSERESAERSVEEAIAWQGRLDLLILNAGIGAEGAPHEFTVEDWEAILAIDLWQSIWMMRIALPHMLERESGHLAFVSSGWGLQGSAERAPYCVAKFGLVGLAESLARYLIGTNVGVSVIFPGYVASDIWRTTRFANQDSLSADEIESRRTPPRFMGAAAEPMGETIVEGIRAGQLYIEQSPQTGSNWVSELLRSKAELGDQFILGERR